MSLFDEVVSGAYTTEGYEGAGVSADVAQEIEESVTDEPYTAFAYTSSCFEAMDAAGTALYAMEGRCAVKYATATEESAKSEAVSTMEASLRGAWETIKDYAARAWEAIKKFIKKVWGKIKGYASVIRNFFNKYTDVIKGKNVDGLKVKWAEIHPERITGYVNSLSGKLDKNLGQAANSVEQSNQMFSNADVRRELNRIVYGDENGVQINDSMNFKTIMNEAMHIADLGYDKWFQGFLKFGDVKEKEYLKYAKQAVSDTDTDIDKAGANKSKSKALTERKKWFKTLMNMIQLAVSILREAITKKYSLAVAACRKAVRYQAGDNTASESFTDYQSILGEIL